MTQRHQTASVAPAPEVQTAVGAIATGAAIAMAGPVVLLLSAVSGLGNFVDPWLAALSVGAAVLLVGYMMVRSAKGAMRASSMVPEHTVEAVKIGVLPRDGPYRVRVRIRSCAD